MRHLKLLAGDLSLILRVTQSVKSTYVYCTFSLLKCSYPASVCFLVCSEFAEIDDIEASIRLVESVSSDFFSTAHELDQQQENIRHIKYVGAATAFVGGVGAFFTFGGNIGF